MPSWLELKDQLFRHRVASFTQVQDSSDVGNSHDLNFTAIQKTDTYSRALDGCKKMKSKRVLQHKRFPVVWVANISCTGLDWKEFPVLALKVQEHEWNHTHILKMTKMTMQAMLSLHLDTSELSFHMLESKNLKTLACRKAPVWWDGQEGTPVGSAASWHPFQVLQGLSGSILFIPWTAASKAEPTSRQWLFLPGLTIKRLNIQLGRVAKSVWPQPAML